MEINEVNEIYTLKSIEGQSSESFDDTLASKVKVTLHTDAEGHEMSDFSKNEMAHEEISEKCSDPLEVIHGGLFKRKVSELIENKEVWEELKKESRKDFGTVTKQLLKKSSIYAVAQVGHAESIYRKILWLFVFAAGLFGCCYEIHRFLNLYFQYPVVVNLQVENNWNLEFPAVTVCNLNRMKRSYEACMERNVTTEHCIIGSQVSSGRTKLVISERQSVASCSVLMSGIKDDKLEERMKFLTKYAKMDPKRRKTFGHQLLDFVLNCTYNGVECSFDLFSDFQSLRYGNCFTFNRFQNDINASNTVLRTSSTGIMNGLDLVLNLDPKNYLSVTSSVGARVIIYEPNTDPNPEEQGVNISPGFETTLSMKQTSVRRLPAPYKDKCVNYENDTSVRGRNQDECIITCIQEQNYGRCLCIDPTLPPFADYKQCNMTNTTVACCLDEVLEIMAKEGLPCKCPLPCFSTKYNLRISTAVWPSRTNYFQSDCNSCTNRNALKLIRTNQARLRVYYSSLERTTYEQKEMFQNSELFSQLGGQMGLWLGLSLVAAFEIIENFLYIGKYCAGMACFSKKS